MGFRWVFLAAVLLALLRFSSVDGVFNEVEPSKRNFQDTASQVLALGAALRPFVLEACGGELSSALRETHRLDLYRVPLSSTRIWSDAPENQP